MIPFPDLTHLTLKGAVMLIGIWFSNPFVPDFGTQLLAAVTIGLLLPEKIVNPLNELVLRIPGIKKFEGFLKKHKKLRTIIPRIFAGYVMTYIIGWSLLGIGYFLL
jgi:hypothetical protein